MKLGKYISKKVKEIDPKDRQEMKDYFDDPNFNLEKEFGDFLSTDISPKIKQKIDLLLVNKNFMQRTLFLRKKWAPLVKEFDFALNQMGSFLMKAEVAEDESVPLPPSPETIKEAEKLRRAEKFNTVLTNKDFDSDAISLAEENKLYPLEWWKESIKCFILMKFFIPMSYFLPTNLTDSLSRYRKFKMPTGLNFESIIEKNQKTGELEQLIKIFPDTSLSDVKKNWKSIKDSQNKLKEIKGIEEKHFYPLRNIEVTKKAIKLKKEGKSDWEIQEDVFGEIPGLNFGEKETKRKNQIKQLRHRGKKRGII
jgi:hypothetical protein